MGGTCNQPPRTTEEILRAQIDGLEGFVKHIERERDSIASQLAESRAANARLREALINIRDKAGECYDGKRLCHDPQHVAHTALAAPSPDAREWEAMREFVDAYSRLETAACSDVLTAAAEKDRAWEALKAARAGRRP